MKIVQIIFREGLFFFLLVLLVGCASTRMTSFKDPDYEHKSFKRILVVVNSTDLEKRFFFESSMVSALTKLQVTAIEGYKLFPPTRELTQSDKVDILLKNQIDAYITVAVGETGVQDVYFPPTTTTKTEGSASVTGNQIHYEEKSKTKTQGGFTISKPWAEFGAKLIDAASGNTAWIATAFTGGSAFSSFNTVITSFCNQTADNLEHDGLITLPKPKPIEVITKFSVQDTSSTQPPSDLSALEPYLYHSENRKLVHILFEGGITYEVYLVGETPTKYLLSKQKDPIRNVSSIMKDRVKQIDYLE